MVAIQDNPFDADQRAPDRGPDRAGGLRHIADVLSELFEQFPLPALQIEPRKIEESVAV